MTFATVHRRIGLVTHTGIEHAGVTLHLGSTLCICAFWLLFANTACVKIVIK